MRTGEEPGFRRVGRPRTVTGAEAFANDPHLTRAEARRHMPFAARVLERVTRP